MADSKITSLTAYTSPISTDLFAIVDITNGITKKITQGNLGGGSTVSLTPTGSGDESQINTAISTLSTAGGGEVFLREGTFVLANPIVPKSNVVLAGTGSSTIIKTSANINAVQNDTNALSDFVFDGIKFVGNVTSSPTSPTRARTTSGNGMTCAIFLDGSLDTNASGPVITNITVRNCIFDHISTATPPIKLFGITGKCIVVENEFTYTLDAGFTFNQEVIFALNHVYGSADNGVSISRGNIKAVCVGNTIENCCYNGIWLAGFSGQAGPTNISCVGNTIKDVGWNGITLQDAPSYAVVSGNSIDQGYNRGASDETTDLWCNGIMISGYPYTSPSSPTSYATEISVFGNQIRTAPRAGIYLNGAKGVHIGSNFIADVGTQYLVDGTTAILSSSTVQNIGILVDNTTTVTNVRISNNMVIDQRGTAYCNYGVYPLTTTGVTVDGNSMAGCRNASNLTLTTQS